MQESAGYISNTVTTTLLSKKLFNVTQATDEAIPVGLAAFDAKGNEFDTLDGVQAKLTNQ